MDDYKNYIVIGHKYNGLGESADPDSWDNVKYDFATKTAIGIKGNPVKNLCSQLSGFTLNELFDCCDDEKYAKFLRFIRDSETYSYSISNIGTILDRVPRYDRFEQIFSAGFDDIIKDGYRFKYSINEIPKSLIKLCRKYPIKLSNDTVKYYKENQDAHYIAYNLDYLTLSPDDIMLFGMQKSWDRVDGNLNIIHFSIN